MINITAELMLRDIPGQTLKRNWGGNIMRVFKEAEQLRESDMSFSPYCLLLPHFLYS
jgi:hypothetical protein